MTKKEKKIRLTITVFVSTNILNVTKYNSLYHIESKLEGSKQWLIKNSVNQNLKGKKF
jgi:hypothetical protein